MSVLYYWGGQRVPDFGLTCKVRGSCIENYYSTCLFIAKGNSPPRAEGQRWEAQ